MVTPVDDIYYRASALNPPNLPSLAGRAEADVCVVGAGLAGMTAARELARAGRSVIVLEAQRVGHGASGRNGGFVSPGFSAGTDEIVRRIGKTAAQELYGLSRGGVAYVRKAIAEMPESGAAPVKGWLKVVRHDDADGMRRRGEEMYRDFGRAVAFWPREQVRQVLRTRTYFQGLYDEEAFHIHPLNYLHALSRDAIAGGARIFEMSPARHIMRRHDGWEVTTPDGQVRAGHVVLAGSAYMERLWPALSRAIVPIATYVIASEPLGDRLGEAIRIDAAIADTRRAGDYYRILSDKRLLWGGRITTRRSEPRHLAQMLRQDILRIYPVLGQFSVDHAWSGLMGYAVHKMPIIGELEPGLWALTAFGGHGLATTAMGGTLIAGAIASGDDRWKLFAPYQARWAGGAVGRAGTQMIYWKLKMMDWLDEAASRRG